MHYPHARMHEHACTLYMGNTLTARGEDARLIKFNGEHMHSYMKLYISIRQSFVSRPVLAGVILTTRLYYTVISFLLFSRRMRTAQPTAKRTCWETALAYM